MIGKICFKWKEHSKIKHSYFDLIIGEGGVIIIFGYYFASEERSVPVYCVATIANEGSEFKGEIFIRALCCYSHK